jgi:UDP-glucose 4-epimerase
VSENLSKYYHELYDLSYTIIRLGTAYGPRSRGEDVISIFVKNSIEGRQLNVKSDGKQVRNFIYVEDLAEGCVKALSEKCRNKILTIAGKEQIDIRNLSLIISNLFDREKSIKIEVDNNRDHDYSGKIENINESFKILDWKPSINLKTGIKKYINWYNNEFSK